MDPLNPGGQPSLPAGGADPGPGWQRRYWSIFGGQALSLIGGWERMRGLPASNPQFSVGARARGWLTSLEARTPATTTPKVGRPAIEEK